MPIAVAEANRPFDVDFARTFFPALANGLAFLENAGGTRVPRPVMDSVHSYMTECQVQPFGPFLQSQDAGRRIEEGHRTVAALIGAAPDEVAIGGSTTANTLIAAQALRPLLAPGGEIVITNLDHEAHSGAWRRLEEFGAVVREWRVDPVTGVLELADLEALASPRTRLICVAYCSNITGGITNVPAVVKIARSVGALVSVDGVAYAPHHAVDVKALDVGLYFFSLCKVFGPHLGAVYARRGLLPRLRNTNHFFLAGDEAKTKLMPGGFNHELTAGAAGICAYLSALDRHHFAQAAGDVGLAAKRAFELAGQHEATLAARIHGYLRSKRRVRLIGPDTADPDLRTAIFSFTVEGYKPDDVASTAASRQVAIRSGHLYAYRLIRDLGLLEGGGVVRISLFLYNTGEEVERLIDAIDPVVS